MVLTVHASSTCDVCLDPYDWDDNSRQPHFIGCGHIFCGSCLEQLQPRKCPLCRTVFSTDDVQRLLVDPHTTSDTQLSSPISPGPSQVSTPPRRPIDDPDDFATDLMKKLVLSYQSSDQDLLEETETWLDNRDFKEDCPVRKARALVLDYHHLKQRKRQDKRVIKQLHHAILESHRKAEEDALRLAEAMKKQDELQRQVDESKKEISRLQRSLADAKAKKKEREALFASSNPLPTPPRHVAHPSWTSPSLTSPDPLLTPVPSNFHTPHLPPASSAIHAPAPRYPSDSPPIIQSYGLLTFNESHARLKRTGSVHTQSPLHKFRHQNDISSSPEVVDGSEFWTCQTTQERLPDIATPHFEHAKMFMEHTTPTQSPRTNHRRKTFGV